MVEVEIWKRHPKYRHLVISTFGRVISLGRFIKNTFKGKCYTQYLKRRLLSQRIGKRGYYLISCKGPKKVHRLVAETFIDNPDNKRCVNHIDLNKLNNNVNNLEWVTNQENMRHAFDNGVFNRKGTHNGRSKLDNSKVSFIRNNKNKFTISDLAIKFNVSWTTIKRVIRRETWLK